MSVRAAFAQDCFWPFQWLFHHSSFIIPTPPAGLLNFFNQIVEFAGLGEIIKRAETQPFRGCFLRPVPGQHDDLHFKPHLFENFEHLNPGGPTPPILLIMP